MICESTLFVTLLHKINKLISRLPISSYSFSSLIPPKLPASNANDFFSSLSQIQSTCFHSLCHCCIPATTHLDDCRAFLLFPLPVLFLQQSASKVSFQTVNLGTSFLGLKCISAAALSLGNVWTPKLCDWTFACLPVTSLPVSILCSCSPKPRKLSSGATERKRPSHTSRPVWPRLHSQHHPEFYKRHRERLSWASLPQHLALLAAFVSKSFSI